MAFEQYEYFSLDLIVCLGDEGFEKLAAEPVLLRAADAAARIGPLSGSIG